MHLDDIFLFTTSHLLKISNENYPRAAQEVADLFPNCDFKNPKKENVLSISGTDEKGTVIPYFDWIQSIRSQGFNQTEVQVVNPNDSLPTMIASAFANGVNQYLSISSKDKTLFYISRMIYANNLLVTGKDLEKIFDMQFEDQKTRDELWMEILKTDVNRYGKFIEATTITEARKFFEEFESHHSPADEVLRTAQHFVAKKGGAFKIPPEYADKFEKRSLEDIAMDRDVTYKPYRIEPLSAHEMVVWFESQGRGEATWATFHQEIMYHIQSYDDSFDGKFKRSMTPAEVKSAFLTLTEDQLFSLPEDIIIQAIGSDFKVPEILKHKFYFPEIPPMPDEDLWHACPNPNPWQMLTFAWCGEEKRGSTSNNNPNIIKLVDEFTTQVQAAESFAKWVDSPFREAFTAALWVMKSKNINLENEETLVESAKQNGFSDIAQSVLIRSISIALCKALQLPEFHVRTMLAVELANVFGGMGSWNDQGFENPEEQSEFQKVSDALFQKLHELRVALI